jgi:hypothetical protein
MGDGRAEATPADIRSALGVLTRATMALALLVVFGLGAVAWAG